MISSTKTCKASSNSGEVSVTNTASVICSKLSGNRARKMLKITNCDASLVLYVGVGFVPTTTSFSDKLNPGVSLTYDGTVMEEAMYGLASAAGPMTVRIYEGI